MEKTDRQVSGFICVSGLKLLNSIQDAIWFWSANQFSLCLQFQGTEMAKYFESLVRNDPFFEIPAKRHLGLVVFRLKVMCSCVAP